MRKLAAAVMVLALLVPGAAFAGSSTDAALGLGAFAVFNQIISGTGIFGHSSPAVVTRPTVIERQVVVAPPPPVVRSEERRVGKECRSRCGADEHTKDEVNS